MKCAAGLALSNVILSSLNPTPPQKISTIKTAAYTQIPLQLSLYPTPLTSFTPPNIKHGKLENVHLLSLSKQGRLREALEFIEEMNRAGVSVTPISYKCLLETCGNLKSLYSGKLIHNQICKMEHPPLFLQNCLLKMYGTCGSLSDMHEVFEEMRDKNLHSWLTVVTAYADHGWLGKSLDMFWRMQDLGFRADTTLYIVLLRSLFSSSYLELGKQLHCHVVKAGFNGNVIMDTVLCNMYAKCGCLQSAELCFDQMGEKNAISWTTLIVRYSQAGKQDEAMKLFCMMVRECVELDNYVFSIALKMCGGLEEFEMGRQVHSLVVKHGSGSDVTVGTPLVDFYMKCGNMESACQVFERISEPNDVSWSAIISGYCQHGEYEKSCKTFESLRCESSNLNEFTYTSIFQACSALAELSLGSQVHADAIKTGMVLYHYGESAMITMYAKCGRLDYARQIFKSIEKPDTVTWTAMIAGCAYHGDASEALKLFRRMLASDVRPNAVTFVAVFTACSHSGRIKEAEEYLESMSSIYGVEPTIDHYDCMIDIYSRAGLLCEAYNLIETMPFEPDSMSWKSLLGGCSIHHNFELGKIAAEKLLQIDPSDTAAYILMFNLHTSSGNFREAANIRRLMAERNLKKELGCSWITVRGKVHRFIVGDKHHPQTKEIYRKLEDLEFQDRNNKSEFLTEDDISNILPERKEQLLVHSERLAIVFGLISMPNNSSIMVFKNLRACKSCHDFGKHISLVTGRQILVRDSTRFHHFIGGECSCGDYW